MSIQQVTSDFKQTVPEQSMRLSQTQPQSQHLASLKQPQAQSKQVNIAVVGPLKGAPPVNQQNWPVGQKYKKVQQLQKINLSPGNSLQKNNEDIGVFNVAIASKAQIQQTLEAVNSLRLKNKSQLAKSEAFDGSIPSPIVQSQIINTTEFPNVSVQRSFNQNKMPVVGDPLNLKGERRRLKKSETDTQHQGIPSIMISQGNAGASNSQPADDKNNGLTSLQLFLNSEMISQNLKTRPYNHGHSFKGGRQDEQLQSSQGNHNKVSITSMQDYNQGTIQPTQIRIKNSNELTEQPIGRKIGIKNESQVEPINSVAPPTLPLPFRNTPKNRTKTNSPIVNSERLQSLTLAINSNQASEQKNNEAMLIRHKKQQLRSLSTTKNYKTQASSPIQGVQGAPLTQTNTSRPNSKANILKSEKIQNVVTKFSFATKGGVSMHNPYKQNQDAYITNPHILQLRHCHFFSVCDGHGHNGHDVSGLLKHRLPFNIESQLKISLQGLDNNYPSIELMSQNLTKAFSDTNKEVYAMVSDVRFSGSTCVSVLTYGKRLYVANVGDSRAIVIRALDEQNCSVTQISRDHKPDDPDEAKVILQNNGRIDSYRDQLGNQIGPMRVWLKHEDTPGLAMSRSFGDSMACRAGVHAVPEVKMFELIPEDKIIVIASDGVWEFLENQQVANIVYPYLASKNAEGAAEALVLASYKRWRQEESNIDDITCIIVFLDVK